MLATKEKHIKLANILSEKVKNKVLLPGQKIPSQSELGRKYSMSRTSVHYAFNELEKRGVITRRPGKGIYVKDKEVTKKLETISVILPETQRLEVNDYNNFGLEIFWGIEKGLREKNLDCKLRIISNSERPILTSIISELKSDGVILARTFSDYELKQVMDLGIPVALAGRISGLPNVSGTASNIFDYYNNFCKQLISEGNKKIAILSRKDIFTNEDFELVAKSLDKQRDDISVKLLYYTPEENTSKKDDDFIYNCVQRMVDDNELPDVFIGATDWVAFRIIEKLTSLGISVPEKIKVVGCLDIVMPPNDFPKITTFNADAFELGRRAVDAICKSHENNNEPVLEKLSMEYIERETYKKIS